MICFSDDESTFFSLLWSCSAVFSCGIGVEVGMRNSLVFLSF